MSLYHSRHKHSALCPWPKNRRTTKTQADVLQHRRATKCHPWTRGDLQGEEKARKLHTAPRVPAPRERARAGRERGRSRRGSAGGRAVPAASAARTGRAVPAAPARPHGLCPARCAPLLLAGEGRFYPRGFAGGVGGLLSGVLDAGLVLSLERLL